MPARRLEKMPTYQLHTRYLNQATFVPKRYFSLNQNFHFPKRSTAAFDKRAENAAQPNPIDKNRFDNDADQATMQHQLNSAANDRLGDLLDLNSEPAVEDLMRQIMSQAKLWEAIQEANREMVIQKSNAASKSRERFPLTFSAQ